MPNGEWNYLHQEFDLGPNETIQVTLDQQAYVRLLDSANYQKYRTGQPYTYSGGLATVSPTYLRAPDQGHWPLVIALAGYPGTVHASIQILEESDVRV